MIPESILFHKNCQLANKIDLFLSKFKTVKKANKIRIVLCLLLLANSIHLFSQDEETTDQTLRSNPRERKVLVGLYVASYFANKYSASAYNGYGFDLDGNRNIFTNSWLNQKLFYQYGPGNPGAHDYIADALGVDQGQWSFNENDMPFNMHYTPAILVGANFKIHVTKKSSVLVNINGTKLNIEGNFTITTFKPNNPNPLINNNVQTFAIRGGEQRLIFQLGYQQLLGEDDTFNFLLEGGLVGTLAKFDKNLIYINNLTIDLTSYNNQAVYSGAYYPTKRPIGFALGAFAGMGANIDVSPKFIVQMLYSPSYEKINIGTNPKGKLQNAIGLRMYYKLGNKKQTDTGVTTGQ